MGIEAFFLFFGLLASKVTELTTLLWIWGFLPASESALVFKQTPSWLILPGFTANPLPLERLSYWLSWNSY